METKFIEGTNKQYSIREDGVVIKHFRLNRGGSITYNDRVSKVHKGKNGDYFTDFYTSEGKYFRRSVKGLVAKYFNLHNPYTCKPGYLKICFKDNDKSNCSIDNLYYSERKHPKTNVYFSEEERVLELKTKREEYINSEQAIINRKRVVKKYLKKQVVNISRSYIANLLKIPIDLLDENLYEHHKKLLLLKREVANENNIPVHVVHLI